MYKVLVFWGCILIACAIGQHEIIPSHGYIAGPGYDPKPYQFAYQTENFGGANSRHETADGFGAVVGSYSLSDADGRKRIVDYIADGAGFRASVKTNEPGTKSESPADVPTISEAINTPVAHALLAPYNVAYGSPYHYGGYGYHLYRGQDEAHSGHNEGALPCGGKCNAAKLPCGGKCNAASLPCGGKCNVAALPCGGKCNAAKALPCGGRCAVAALGNYGLIDSAMYSGPGYGGHYP